MKKYMYDAFISYRHTELDKFVAENLHKQLEAFRLPGNISKNKKGRTKIERVFRDKDELPLTSNLEDPLMKALHSSEYLIVICSPRLRESLWCKKEIETFIGIHGREKVLAVLIEGEPEDAFPEALLYAEEVIQNEDGTTETVRKELEPLAADIRGKNKKAMLKNLRVEILRLMAPMFSLSYDDLRQRHRERRFKRILTASLMGMLICLAFGAVSTTMALRIQSQKEQIEKQNDEIIAKTVEIKFQNQSLLKNQAVNLADESMRLLEAGDRVGAIQVAVSALTQYDGIDMPYTCKAQYALTQSLHVYDNGSYIKAQYQLETAGIIDFMLLSPNWEILLTYDNSNTLTIWDIESGSALDEIKDLGANVFRKNNCTFLGNDRFAYLNSENSISIYSISQKKVTDTIEILYSGGLCGDEEGKYLVIKNDDNIILLDGELLEEIAVYEASDGYSISGEMLLNQEGTILVFEEIKNSEDIISTTTQKDNLYFWNLTDNKVSKPLDVGVNRLEDIRYVNDIAYILLNYIGDDFETFRATLLAYSLSKEQVLWKQVFEDEYANYLSGPYVEGADKLLYASMYEARLISMTNGSVYAEFPLGNVIVGGAVFTNQDVYLAFTRNGEYHTIVVERAQNYTVTDRFQSHSQNVKEFQVMATGYLILPYQDNRVTIYEYSNGIGLTESSQEVNMSPPEEILRYTEAVDLAREKGFVKAELARCIFYDTDKSKLFVYYTDNTLEIYNTSDMSLLCSLSGLTGEVQQYLGTDEQGNLYIAGSSYGYMISSDYELLGMIEGLVMVDREKNCLVINHTYQTFYTVPIYTVEELLAMAEAYVLK